MVSKRNIIMVVLLLVVAITACSQSPALIELRQRHIDYTEESFIKYVEKGDKSVVDLFLTAGMSPDAKSKEGISALTIAARGGHTEIVTLLLAKGADVNAKDNEGWTALMKAARLGNTDVVKILIDKGADVNAKDGDGNTALIIAAMDARAEIVSLLLAKGADVNARNNAGYTGLTFAKKYAYAQIADILEKAGATIPKESIEGLLTVADSQWQKGDYQNALQNYQEILLLEPNNSKAKEFLKKYSAIELTDEEIKDRFEKKPELNEFEQKNRTESQKEFLSRKETYFSILDKEKFAISKYDFKQKRFIITVGLRKGEATAPAFGEFSGVVTNDIFLIVNEDGKHLAFPLYINEEKAASLKSKDKEDLKIFIIYKLKKVERFTDALGFTPSRANPRGSAILVDRFRRYIKPLYIALLTGNEKYVLYEVKGSEIKSEAMTKTMPIEKRMKRK